MHTEFEFTLPRGYIDASGQVHRKGIMRLARAKDEIDSINDHRVQSNEAYLPVVLISRVLAQLGSLSSVTPKIVEDLFATDLAYLEDLYLRLNDHENVVLGAECPHCHSHFKLQVSPLTC